MLWTDRQRRTLIAVMAGVLVLLVFRYYLNPTEVSDPLPVQGLRAHEVPGRIDPNTADLAALMALPGIGPGLARRIIDDRESFMKSNAGGVPYDTLDDLNRVKGIGEATLRSLEPYLIFPGE